MEAQTETKKEPARNGRNLPKVERTFQLVKPEQHSTSSGGEEQIVSTSPSGDHRAAQARPMPTWRSLTMRLLGGLMSVVVLVLVWWAVAAIGNYPTFILPTPLDVAEKMGRMALDGSLFSNTWTTVVEASLGFIVALLLGTTGGYLIGHSRFLEKILSPYIALSQGLPVVAIAPLLAIWVRNDLAEKIFVVALIVFFPILVNSIVAVRSIDRSMYEVALISGANRWQTLRYVELPLGLRSLLGGVKLGLTLAITGAVIGEFISAGSGLGFLLTFGRGTFDTPLVFVGLVCLAALTIIAYTFVTVLEKALITWE
jgi:NitT/TauT family transport system permease protein